MFTPSDCSGSLIMQVGVTSVSWYVGDDPLAEEVCDLDSVAGVLKLYFRGMENPLFPKDSYEQLMECGRKENVCLSCK